jgi:periplasmic protein TorT
LRQFLKATAAELCLYNADAFRISFRSILTIGRLASLRKHILGLFALLLASTQMAQARDAWYPLPVDVWEPPFNTERIREERDYVPLPKAREPWRICVLIPHLKDSYWLSVNFAIVDAARRLGVSFALYSAGGYGNVRRQQEQLTECLAEAPDGILLSSVSLDAMNEGIARAAAAGVPVVDMINGVSAPEISARVGADFWDMGRAVGEYLAELTHGTPASVAWLPGPAGAGWVEASDSGFRQAIADEDIEIVDVRYGDTGFSAQRKLIEESLAEHQVDYIVGTAVTAEAAPSVFRDRKMAGEIGVLADYYSPGVHRAIRRGHVIAAPSDLPALQARIAMDTLVRIIEGEPFFAHVSARVVVIDREMLTNWDPSAALPPRGFRPVFNMGWH